MCLFWHMCRMLSNMGGNWALSAPSQPRCVWTRRKRPAAWATCGGEGEGEVV